MSKDGLRAVGLFWLLLFMMVLAAVMPSVGIAGIFVFLSILIYWIFA